MGTIAGRGAADLVGAARAVQSAAHNAVGKKLASGKDRLRSQAKTRKSVATRERILQVASELMVERRGTEFQMSEVSARCHMSKGAVYYYFADKGELIDAIFDKESEELVATIEQVVSEAPSARDALMELVGAFAEGIRSSSPLAMAMTRELSNPSKGASRVMSSRYQRVVEIVSSQIELAKREGSVRDGVESGLTAIFLTGGFLVTSLASTTELPPTENATLARDLYQLVCDGIGA